MSQTQAEDLAKQYLALGGTRLALIDDNKVFVRQWEDEPSKAESFWHEHIECLDQEQQRQVALLLPSVSDEDSDQALTSTQGRS